MCGIAGILLTPAANPRHLAAIDAAPLLLYLYLPWAAWADRPVNWGDTRTWANFLFHVTGRQYRGLMFTAGPGELWERLGRYLAYLPGQFGSATSSTLDQC